MKFLLACLVAGVFAPTAHALGIRNTHTAEEENELNIDSMITQMHVGPPEKGAFFEKPLSTSQVLFVRVDTRQGDPVQLAGPAGWNFTVTNVGAGKPWSGYKSKIQYIDKYINAVPSNQLVVFIDSADVMYGGCNLNGLVQHYEDMVSLTSAHVFIGAEFNCFEMPCKTFRENRREKVLQSFKLNSTDIDSWASSKNKGSRRLKYLNSGFIIGTAGYFKTFSAEWMRAYQPHDCERSASHRCTDQGAAGKVFEARPDLVELDYAGIFVDNLFGRSESKGYGHPHYLWNTGSKKWINQVTGAEVCFFHGNGPAEPVLFDLAAEQRRQELNS